MIFTLKINEAPRLIVPFLSQKDNISFLLSFKFILKYAQ